jgi:hypothetical protein
MGVKLRLLHDLPIVDIEVNFQGKSTILSNILVDTGSAGTIFDADAVIKIGVQPEGTDRTAILHGIDGSEIVFSKIFDFVKLGEISIVPVMFKLVQWSMVLIYRV